MFLNLIGEENVAVDEKINSNKGCFWIHSLRIFRWFIVRLTVTKVVFELMNKKLDMMILLWLTVAKVVLNELSNGNI